MSKVQDYPSRLGDNSSRKFETFSYLPAMNDKQIRQQVQYIVDQGYNPGVEHTEVENAMDKQVSEGLKISQKALDFINSEQVMYTD